MVVYSIPHRRRMASCLSLAIASGGVFLTGWEHAWFVSAVAAVTATWICFESQRVEVDRRSVTLTRTMFGRTFGGARTIETSSGVRAVLSVLLPRKGLPFAIRRLVFLVDGRVIARTKDLPPDIEAHLLLSLWEETNIEVSTIESGGAFRPNVQ